MSHWLYRLSPTRPAMVDAATDTEAEAVTAHVAYLVALEQRGVLVLAGRTQEGADSVGLVIFEADDEPTARAVMAADPAVRARVMHATLHPYAIAVARAGLTH